MCDEETLNLFLDLFFYVKLVFFVENFSGQVSKYPVFDFLFHLSNEFAVFCISSSATWPYKKQCVVDGKNSRADGLYNRLDQTPVPT